ncbi:MAG: PIN domain-containing protein [Treponema sp.]|nr:PIN domain-containing protein [Treponema sp.]
MKVLVDTNIILDVFLKREPFYKDSIIIFQLTNSGSIKGYLAAVSMTNIFYLLRKAKIGTADVYQIMDKLAVLFTVATISESTIANALALRWKDFEDAVQYISVKENEVDYIITRNADDFQTSDIPCMSPADFITLLKEKE